MEKFPPYLEIIPHNHNYGNYALSLDGILVQQIEEFTMKKG
jgi:hypothetical protein